MTKKIMKTVDGNFATAKAAHLTNEVCAIYPITPSSNMGEYADEMSANGEKNIYGTIPHVVEMQSEGGASAAVHGSLQAGALTTTFTASQGLLLMIPSMYKIAGELTPTVFHVSARSLACQALSIFCDHSDVMAVRTTGFALLASESIQSCQDLAIIAQAASLEARVPFVHFFDGFRTSHELKKIEMISEDEVRQAIDDKLVLAHRARRLHPENPVVRGTSQNPDVYFQGRESVNSFYDHVPEILEKHMENFAKITGREYNLVDYFGAKDANRAIVIMGSGAETTEEAVEYLNQQGEKIGVINIHLFLPFPAKYFLNVLPKTVKKIAVLDRTKEPGSLGEPLYQNVLTAFAQLLESGKVKDIPQIVGGRYGLSSKEYTPAMIKAIFDELKKEQPKNHFTIGIHDDMTHTSLKYDPSFCTEDDKTIRAVFFGLGSDGTVSANKNTIKIIGESTDMHVQGYFVYDSKKAGARTISHLRFGHKPIKSAYLITSANFVGCHQFNFLEQIDVLDCAVEGATVLLNSPYEEKDVWNKLPRIAQEHIINKKLKLYSIDAYSVAREVGLDTRINTIMQTCFFHIANVIDSDTAIKKIKEAIHHTYAKKGEDIVNMNIKAVDQAISNLHEIEVPSTVTSKQELFSAITDDAPDFVKNVTKVIMMDKGNDLPVSKMPNDGTFPTNTTKWEKRNIALYTPEWDSHVCIQCGLCSLVCPHAILRAKKFDKSLLDKAPKHFESANLRMSKDPNEMYTLQVYVEDCTGCGMCVQNCPAKDKENPEHKAINMTLKEPRLEKERENVTFFENLPEVDKNSLNIAFMKDIQFVKPLFEFSGSCAGCGETNYVRLISQLFGERMLIGNATGCSSIYGGNLPTTPWAQTTEGCGPTWNNSLFEDAAEFSFGFRLAEDKHKEHAHELLQELSDKIGGNLAQEIMTAKQETENEFKQQRERIKTLKQKLQSLKDPRAIQLLSIADFLIKHSIWGMGGDGWAYDIGYGGLDHVLAMGRDINLFIMDTQVYSNTGGQSSKATPYGAVAKFAVDGKKVAKKDLGMMAISYGHVYVAQISLGGNPTHAVKAIIEAEKYKGPSLIIAYSHCIAHGFDLRYGLQQQKLAVQSGFWPLYRYNPDLSKENKNPFKLDSKAPTIPLYDYRKNEMRFKFLEKTDPKEAKRLLKLAEEETIRRFKVYEHMANQKMD